MFLTNYYNDLYYYNYCLLPKEKFTVKSLKNNLLLAIKKINLAY